MQTVISPDGTRIAFDTTGHGPAVLLVTGATGTRASWSKLAELLSPNFTVYAYDRRGRGDSTDTQPFAVEREIEDIEALIDFAGGTMDVYGISSGACLALEAALKLGNKITKLALYEAPYSEDSADIKGWHIYRSELTKALADNRRGDAIELFMKVVGVPDAAIMGMREAPMWAGLEAIAPTLAYDAAAMGDDRTPPVDRTRGVKARTLVMDGGESLTNMPFMRTSAEALAGAIPGAKRKTIAGQGHDIDPGVLAPVLTEFFKS